jgi:phosphate transport system protein
MADKVITGHTLHRYDEELLLIHSTLVDMGKKVSNQLKRSLEALDENDLGMASGVIDGDEEIDALEIRIDEEIVRTIARRAPVARDLRLLMAISKTVTDIERIGDKAVKIADRTLHIFASQHNGFPSRELVRDINQAGNIGIKVLDNILEAFATCSLDKARLVLGEKSEMEREFQNTLRRLIKLVMEDSLGIDHTIDLVFIIKCLDRIVDHSENIAEHLIYLIKGEDVRHSSVQNP